MLTELFFRNFRSLRSVRLELKPLTFIIGPNASGKSNVFKGMHFLHDAVAGDARDWQSYDGKIDDLLWFGLDELGERPGEIEVAVGFDRLPRIKEAAYRAAFRAGRYLEVQSETLSPGRLSSGAEPWLERHEQEILRRAGAGGRQFGRLKREIARSARNLILRDEGPSATMLGLEAVYRHIAGWRFFDVDPRAARRPHFVPEVPDEVPPLAGDASNLSAFLYALWHLRSSDLNAVTEMIIRSLELTQNILTEHDAERGGSQASFYFFETPFGENRPVRPDSLSDGTIRLLAHLALLLADRSVTLACLEEPDSGLHPRLMLYLADALRQAVQEEAGSAGDHWRPQILAVTHSPELLDCFDLSVEADYLQVYVADRGEKGETVLTPVTAEQFAPWLEKYRLGEAVRRHFL